jgi:DNA-directed RNA polymerase subunit RPC12/RpoP
VIYMKLPKCDEWGTPIAKMPNCPVCDEDELGMMQPGSAFCYRCGAEIADYNWGQNRPQANDKSHCPNCGHFWLRDYPQPVTSCPRCNFPKPS